MLIIIKDSIQKLVRGLDLTPEQATATLMEIMTGKATGAQIASFLTALSIKGVAVAELIAFANVMREKCLKINPKISGRLIDTCGTGGDKIKTFNISTSAAFVISGAGVAVAKHGNRAVTSKSGSADVLETLGVKINMDPLQVQKSIEEIGIGFMFAPDFHPALKYAVIPRRDIGIRTVFNLLGPITNPANVDSQLIGVYDEKLTVPIANALRIVGCKEAFVVHGLDGLDEISTSGKTAVSRLKNGKVSTFELAPNDFEVKQVEVNSLCGGGTSENNAVTLYKILSNNCADNDPKKDIVLVNAAIGVILGGLTDDLKSAFKIAKKSLEEGFAYQKLKLLVHFSGGDLSILKKLEGKHD